MYKRSIVNLLKRLAMFVSLKLPYLSMRPLIVIFLVFFEYVYEKVEFYVAMAKQQRQALGPVNTDIVTI